MKNKILGILAIILGLIVIASPLAGLIAVDILAILTGFLILFIGIWLVIAGASVFSTSKAAGILNVILGIIAIYIGLDLFFNIYLFSFLVGFLLYIGGIFLIIAGLVTLIAKEMRYALWSGILSIVLGIIYILVGTFAFNPLFLGILIGVWLFINGIFLLVEPEK